MPEYIFWYKKTLKANDLVTAIKNVNKVKYSLDSIKEKDEEELIERQGCIGFEL